jgi:hypothetical protein
LRVFYLDLGACARTILSHHSKQKIMKTQIIRRIILAVIALFICYSNNNNKAQINKQSSANATSETKTSIANDLSNTTSIHCVYCLDEHTEATIPEPSGEHEFHSFHVKDKHVKHGSFLKSIANKMIDLIYYLVILIMYLPFKTTLIKK